MNRAALFALLVLGVSMSTISAASAQSVEVSTTVAFESRYVFRGLQFSETSIQPAINLSYGNFYLNSWFNLPIGDDDLVVTPGGEELDLIAGYSASLNDLISYNIGLTYYVFPDLASGFFDVLREDGDGLGANTLEPYVGVAFDVALAPSVYLYHDFFLDTTTVQGNVSHSFPLSEKTSFDLGGYIGYVLDDAGGTDYLYGTASADLYYTLSDIGSVYTGLRYGGSDIAGGAVFAAAIHRPRQAGGVWWGVWINRNF
jgi:uncharacterized protein (TIGR02001 family)